MRISKQNLKNHVWLVKDIARAEPTGELEERGFNYFTRKKGKPVAYKLIRLR